MLKIAPLKIYDLAILKKIKIDSSFAAHLHVLPQFKLMRKRYIQYKRFLGSPFLLAPVIFDEDFKSSLKYHFSHPRSELDYIEKIRYKLSPNCCPLCGGFGTHTVDHFLPKATYPEFTIFSLNLVPACSCNSLRSNVTHGSAPHESTIHPYFDQGLDERLIKATIRGRLLDEDVEVNFEALPCLAIHLDKINFHIEHVIRKSAARHWMEGKWAMLIRRPASVITTIPDNLERLTEQTLIEYLDKIISDTDKSHATPNNWYSMFFYGIRTDAALLSWLVDHYNGIKDGTIDPLAF